MDLFSYDCDRDVIHRRGTFKEKVEVYLLCQFICMTCSNNVIDLSEMNVLWEEQGTCIIYTKG